MKIFKDIVNNDEVLTDVYPMELIASGTVYKVKGKLTSESTDIDESKLGANKSAEGEDADAGADPSSVHGINVVLANKLMENPMDKKTFLTCFKAYMKNVKAKLQELGTSAEEIQKFQDGVSAFTKESILPGFKDDEWQFFFGEKSIERGFDTMPVLVKWDEETPYLYYFKHGLLEEKV